MQNRYSTCQYHHGKYCVSKICMIVFLLLFTTLAGLLLTGLAFWFDNWAGISTNPYATLDLSYPRLGSNHLDYVMFNKTIPNDDGTLYKYIDDNNEDVRFITSRYGFLSQCKLPVQGPKIDLLKTPWKAPVCKASRGEYQCPIIAMRTSYGSPIKSPRASTAPSRMNGCIMSVQRCDGVIDCPTGHDELNCPQSQISCGEGMVQCSPNKPVCIPKSMVCNGLNDCGMYEDEQNCCGRTGFLRCGDGSCVMGERCDARVHCFDLSDEYDCPDPASRYYDKCNDGQLVASTFVCEEKEYPSFQCKDFSDETECDSDPKPLPFKPTVMSLSYDNREKCFKQSFTFQELNETLLKLNYPDKKEKEFYETYEHPTTRLTILGCMAASGFVCLISLFVLLCFGNLNKRCRIMRITFLVLAALYLLCIILAIVVGIYWVRYVGALNDVVENASNSNPFIQASIETVQVSGGLATIRISTLLTFYNCGFFGLAMLLCLIAARLLKNASCHTGNSISFTGEYKRNMYSDDMLTANDLLLSSGSSNNSGDNGIATPDQIVTPYRSVKSYDANLLQARSNSTMPLPSRYYSHNHINGTNTYVSYKGDIDSSIEKLDGRYTPLVVSTTLDRGTIRSTPV